MDVYNEVLQISSEETKDKTFIPLEGTITTASKERYQRKLTDGVEIHKDFTNANWEEKDSFLLPENFCLWE